MDVTHSTHHHTQGISHIGDTTYGITHTGDTTWDNTPHMEYITQTPHMGYYTGDTTMWDNTHRGHHMWDNTHRGHHHVG